MSSGMMVMARMAKWFVTVEFLCTFGGQSALAGILRGQLLAQSFAASRFASYLLGARHLMPFVQFLCKIFDNVLLAVVLQRQHHSSRLTLPPTSNDVQPIKLQKQKRALLKRETRRETRCDTLQCTNLEKRKKRKMAMTKRREWAETKYTKKCRL